MFKTTVYKFLLRIQKNFVVLLYIEYFLMAWAVIRPEKFSLGAGNSSIALGNANDRGQ